MYEYQMGEARENCKAHFSNLDIGMEMRSFRTLALLPYMNLEVLTEDPARLLGLLYNRTRYSPEDWAPYDSSKLKPCWGTGAFGIVFNPNCVILHGAKYGELIPWDPKLAHVGEIVGYPRAQLILEAQDQLLRNLAGIVGHILKGNLTATGRNALPEGWTRFSKLSFKQDHSCGFASSYINQPFSAPPLFDIKKLRSVAQIGTNAAEDHLWLLQTDSAYMRHFLKLSTTAQIAKFEDLPHNFIGLEMAHEAHAVWTWRWIAAEVENLERIYDPKRIKRGEPLPPDINHALGSLETLITYLIGRVAEALWISWACRPGFSSICTVKRREGSSHIFEIHEDGVWDSERFRDDPLAWCLKGLLYKPGRLDDIRAYDHAMLYTFLDHLLATGSSEDSARLDEVLFPKFSNLAVLHEMRDMVLLHRPRSTKLELEDFKKTESRASWELLEMNFLEITLDRLKGRNTKRIFSRLLSDFEATQEPDPTGKRDKRWLNNSDSVQKSLTAFWDAVKEQYEVVFKELGLKEEVKSELLQDLSRHKTPEHLAILKEQRDEILAIIEEERAQRFARSTKGKKGKGGKKSKAAPRKQRTSASRAAKSHTSHLSTSEITDPNSSITNLSLEEPDEAFDSDGDDAEEAVQKMVLETQAKFVKARVIKVVVESKTSNTVQPPKVCTAEISNKPLIAGTSDRTPKTEPAPPTPRTTIVADNSSGPSAPLKERFLNIFHSMFPSGSQASSSIEWESFVKAMAQVGFVARHSGGSAVLFEPAKESKWFKLGKIVFHRPHPDSKIAPIILRSMGKRMGKWFGWTRDSFELEGKDK
jgi:hypothetical protein